MEGRVDPPRIGEVVATDLNHPPYVVFDRDGREVEPASVFLRDLSLSDVSVLTCRSYGFDLLRWFRVLWLLDVVWDRATAYEVQVLVGWMRSGRNPQRGRAESSSSRPGAVNGRTGKAYLSAGYAPRTINHTLSVIGRFYSFHAQYGRGPVVSPVPAARERRAVVAHRNPMEPPRTGRRAPLRQKVPKLEPRALSDRCWDELFAVLRCDRDRALLACYVSSGARASELLGIGLEEVDWARQVIFVVSKGSRLRQAVPVSPEALRYLVSYLAEAGPPAPGEPLWRTRRGDPRPVTYWAMRRVLQRANDALGTNRTLHDLRHTAATRLAQDPSITLPEVRAILRHADINTTGIYTATRVEDLFDKLQQHFSAQRPAQRLATGYDPADAAVVFGA
ncbi:site-specific integrase [Kribbella sp. NBC_01484]|uniref:tyrosine-type recombinase/integrase n=1 Tax=Kribbella sp. NBC_01484 TaxID=2903579 RepID=UPI002E314252|nr:site-specific integrase [Kribbella sp. NBC_01484]